MRLCISLLLAVGQLSLQGKDDYWSEDYDQSRNCVSQKIIEVLLQTGQCITVSDSNPRQAVQKCKPLLFEQLTKKCIHSKIKEPGTLLYCKNRAETHCCFHNHSCIDKWGIISDAYTNEAVNYLRDKDKYLKNLVKSGYKTCHPLKDYNATICHEDCKAQQDSPLANLCKKNNGLFKCCIRRDKVACDECRFCCTYPFCSFSSNGLVVLGEEDLKNTTLADQKNSINPKDLLRAEATMYKGNDSRCLKPGSHADPALWDHYDPEQFVDAITQDDMDKVKTIKFDKRFFNFEDGSVFKDMILNKSSWNDVYGFDFSHRSPRLKDVLSSGIFEAASDCMKMEKSDFAKQCRRDQGIFKCCLITFNLTTFEITRNVTASEKLASATNLCSPNQPSSCQVSVGTYYCTYKDPLTGFPKQRFLSNHDNEIGGFKTNRLGTRKKERVGFRTRYCFDIDFCYDEVPMLNSEQFYAATTQGEICNNTKSFDDIYNFEPKYQEKYEDCMKRRSNVRICPKDFLENKIKSDFLTEMNNELRKLKKSLNKTKKKKPKKKNDKKKNKKKHKKQKNRGSMKKKPKEE